MAVRSAPLWLLLWLAAALPESSFGSSSHSLKYISTGISDPSQEELYFCDLWLVEDQIVAHYDSNSRRMKPRVSWMEKYGPQFWDNETEKARANEETFSLSLEILRNRYNQSEGLHTWQRMCGCELRGDGSKGGFYQYGYDGRTFITFDKEKLTWVPSVPQAQITQRKWGTFPEYNQGWKAFLEEECIEWLQKHLSYGKETLQRTDSPVVTMSSRMATEDGMETHICRIHGFYPKAIDAFWMRDGKVWRQDTLHESVAPNADGTYHCRLSIQIYPEDRNRYRCHVEHNGVREPLDMALKAPKSNKGFDIGYLMAGLLLACVIVGTLIFFKKYQAKCRAASTRVDHPAQGERKEDGIRLPLN